MCVSGWVVFNYVHIHNPLLFVCRDAVVCRGGGGGEGEEAYIRCMSNSKKVNLKFQNVFKFIILISTMNFANIYFKK